MFGKIFKQIFASSIADDWEMRHVFMDLIVLAEYDGVVDMTPESISAITRVPLDIVNRVLIDLQKPDPRSRTPECEGRRLVQLDPKRPWGWRIVNYEAYRGLRDDKSRKAYMRNYMRGRRQEEFDVFVNSVNSKLTQSTPVSPCIYTSTSSSISSSEEGSVEGRSKARGTLEEVVAFCKGAGLSEGDGEWFFYKCEGNGWMNGKLPIKNWRATIKAWQRANYMPSQRLNQGSASSSFQVHPMTQLKAIEEAIAKHPANKEWVGYNANAVTQSQKDELKGMREKVASLKAKIAGGVQ